MVNFFFYNKADNVSRQLSSNLKYKKIIFNLLIFTSRISMIYIAPIVVVEITSI